MNCTEAGPTQSNPRVTEKVYLATLLIAHSSHVNIPTRSPPAFLPGERTSTPYVGIHSFPSLLLFSHHAPKNRSRNQGSARPSTPQHTLCLSSY